MQIAEENNFALEKAKCLNGIGVIYFDLDDKETAIIYDISAKKILDELPGQPMKAALQWNLFTNLGVAYKDIGKLDSALIYLQKIYDGRVNEGMERQSVILMFYGDLQFQSGNRQKGMDCLHQSIEISEKSSLKRGQVEAYNTIARLFKRGRRKGIIIQLPVT